MASDITGTRLVLSVDCERLSDCYRKEETGISQVDRLLGLVIVAYFQIGYFQILWKAPIGLVCFEHKNHT